MLDNKKRKDTSIKLQSSSYSNHGSQMLIFDGNGTTSKPHEGLQRNEDMSNDERQASIFYRDQEDDIEDLSDLSVNFDNLILPETKAFGQLKVNDTKH